MKKKHASPLLLLLLIPLVCAALALALLRPKGDPAQSLQTALASLSVPADASPTGLDAELEDAFGRCLRYEFEAYKDFKGRAPKKGALIETPLGMAKVVEFDTLMERKKYVIFAVFYSADYDEDETGFRYNADIQYKLEAEQWLEEIKENQIYDTGFHARFGDEFITLTTCDRSRRRNGRFVAVARRIREGERII